MTPKIPTLTGRASHRTWHPWRTAAALGLAGALAFGADGCHSRTGQAQSIDNTGVDPALANMAQPGDATPITSSDAGYDTQAPAPIIRNAPAASPSRTTRTSNVQYYPVPQAGSTQAPNAPVSYGQQGYADPQDGYADPNAYAGDQGEAEDAGEQAVIEADQPPPPLPEYDQPPAPEDNYIWTPGYWDYAQTGYYWVPGVWCAPPFVGALWTPPYWGYGGARYRFHRGYWGPHVGYYGGINYGFGYVGFGYFGGYWRDRSFFYNRAVTNVNIVSIHNVYNRTVVYNGRTFGPRPFDRISYNGGRGGINVAPRPQELAALREAHYAPLAYQRENRLAASSNRAQFFEANRGRPAEAFVGRPLGDAHSIPATPQRQAFNTRFSGNNRPGFGGQPNPAQNGGNGYNDRRGFTGQPAQPNQANQPNNNRPGFGGQPAQPGTSGYNNRQGYTAQPGQPAGNARPDLNNRANPGSQPNPSTYGRQGYNGQPNPNGYGNRPGANGQPTTFSNRPATTPQPDSNARPAFNRPNSPFQPTVPAQPGTVTQPGAANNRPGGFDRNNGGYANRPGGGFDRPNDGSFNRPNGGPYNRNPAPQPAAPQPQQAPQPFQRPAPQPQGPRPEFQRPAQPAPQPQARPAFQGNRPAPPPAPAPAPRAGGGDHGNGDHGHH